MKLRVHDAGVANAKALIASGAIDRLSDRPTDASTPDASLCLAVSDDETPVGNCAVVHDGKVYRSALLLAQKDGGDVVAAVASELLHTIDAGMASQVEALRPAPKRVGAASATTTRNWYRFVVDAAQDAAELYIFDEIGENWWTGGGVTAKKFIADLNAVPSSVKSIKVHINSPGGDVFDAIAIANALRQHSASIDISIDGLCASAATIISCAGDTIRMADNALFMVHNPSTIAFGSADDMRSTADALEQIRDAIVATYRWVSSLSANALCALMDAETWMSADQALANGFTTETVTGMKAVASLGLGASRVLNVPEKFRAQFDALVAENKPADAETVLRLCREAGVIDIAEGLIAVKATTTDVTARIATAKTERATKAERAKRITALCANLKLPQLAAGYIDGAMSVEDVQKHLVVIDAAVSGAEIDTKLRPNQAGTAASTNALNPADIYAERNTPKKKE